jgi:hypothetical protein
MPEAAACRARRADAEKPPARGSGWRAGLPSTSVAPHLRSAYECRMPCAILANGMLDGQASTESA